MNLEMQKRLSSKVAKVGLARVKINPENVDQVKEAITKADIRDLIDNKVIEILPLVRNSKARARLRAKAKKKGRQSGPGSKVGTKNARTPTKKVWINRIRLQRKIIKSFKDSGRLSTGDWKILYYRAKGGFFRNKRHLLQTLEQGKLLKEKKK
ncbi:MAG: 50S ribosomal protein L19e [uncultured DHVE6 group euryarchaeote]|jgi:large subunit ribosomal protein L19e|nr:MAG: 50S ribosomal protein L19e [uncultured DHVE6 group euryarchaeote]